MDEPERQMRDALAPDLEPGRGASWRACGGHRSHSDGAETGMR
jgi:hypothetical protein